MALIEHRFGSGVYYVINPHQESGHIVKLSSCCLLQGVGRYDVRVHGILVALSHAHIPNIAYTAIAYPSPGFERQAVLCGPLDRAGDDECAVILETVKGLDFFTEEWTQVIVILEKE